MRFGEFLVLEGVVSSDSVQLALAQQRRRRVPLGVLAVRAEMLDVAKVEKVLVCQARPPRWQLFGRVAKELGLLNRWQVDLLMSRQRETQPRLGELLVEQGALTHQQLPVLLAKHRRPEYHLPASA